MAGFILDFLHNLNADIPDELMDQIEESLTQAASPFLMVVNFFTSLIFDSLFGMLGRLIGYSIYKPKNQVMMPPTMPLPM